MSAAILEVPSVLAAVSEGLGGAAAAEGAVGTASEVGVGEAVASETAVPESIGPEGTGSPGKPEQQQGQRESRRRNFALGAGRPNLPGHFNAMRPDGG